MCNYGGSLQLPQNFHLVMLYVAMHKFKISTSI